MTGFRLRGSEWDRLVRDHAGACAEYRSVALAFDADRWIRPIAPDKWSPAEVTSHVVQAYRVLRGELAGAGGMRLIGSRLQRLILRHTMLPRLLAGNPFPAGVRAPRETRPRDVQGDQQVALSELDHLVAQFTEELTVRAATAPVHLTHAYFGPLSASQGIRLLTTHTRHHARQLAAATGWNVAPLP
jgi:DinB superfamily